MSLREDSDQYCMIWLGIMLLGAYYFHFLYIILTQPTYLSVVASNLLSVILLLLLPLGMVFFFTGYLRPARGKAKRAALGPSLVTALFFVIIAYLLSLGTDMLGNIVFFSGWGISASLLTSGGLSMLQSKEMGTSTGILDVSSLHYGREDEQPEPSYGVKDVEVVASADSEEVQEP